MALQIQTFANFTPDRWAAFKDKIKHDTGTELGEDSGTVTHGSFEFTYSYDSVAETLSIQVLKKPLFINSHTILQGVAEEIAELPETAPTQAQQTVSPVPLPDPAKIPPAATEPVKQ